MELFELAAAQIDVDVVVQEEEVVEAEIFRWSFVDLG